MTRHIYFLLLMMLYSLYASAQTTTFNSNWTYGSNMKARVSTIELQPANSRAYVTIELQPTTKMKRLNVWYDSSAMLKISEWMHLLGAYYGGQIHSISPNAGLGWDKPEVGKTYQIKLVFSGTIYPGANLATLSGDGIFTFSDYTINNPMKYTTSLNSEYSIKQNIDNSKDPICGIYEEVGGDEMKLGLVKIGSEYKIVFLKWRLTDPRMGTTYGYSWKVGDVAAFNIRPTAAGIGKCEWVIPNQNAPKEVYLGFDNGRMYIIENGKEYSYLKTYPLNTLPPAGNSTSIGDSWSGTGFALSSGYIATNYHVVDGATSLVVYGIKGDFSTSYKAKVVASDKVNDLAIIKIEDNRFSGFGNIPYSVKTTLADVGEDIFVLGYPMTTTMGEEIKLTTGVISSRTGFQGDVALYQISAPIQPGNSGGPLFDNSGNIIGVVNAKHDGAENVGYAIKASYLKNLLESSVSANILPMTNTIRTQTLPTKVKSVKNYIYLIKCHN